MAGELELRPTTGPETAGRIAAECHAAGSDLILAAGGDGTINEVLQGIAPSQATLGLLPAGTANCLAVEIGLGGDLIKAAKAMPSMVSVPVTTGTVESGGRQRHFIVMAGAGLDAAIVRRVKPEFKRKFGKVSYWIAGFGALGERLPEFDVYIDGKPVPASFALISRVRNYGGDLEIARHASLLDDDLAVVLFAGENSVRYLKYFSGVLLNQLRGMSGVTLAKLEAVEVRPRNGDQIDLQIDGEYAGLAPASFGICRKAIRLLVPSRFAAAQAK